MEPRLTLNRCRSLLALVVLLCFSSMALAAEFSADFTEKMGNRVAAGKLYLKGYDIRRDVTQGPQKNIMIYRMDKKVIWLLDPVQKTYMEMSAAGKELAYLSPDDPKAKQALKDMGTVKKVGRETVNGYVCDKYAFSYRDKSMGTQYQWVAQKLKVPIKVEQKSPKFQMLAEYKNIKEGGVSSSLFQLPKGYKKTSIPGMPGGKIQMPNMPRRPR